VPCFRNAEPEATSAGLALSNELETLPAFGAFAFGVAFFDLLFTSIMLIFLPFENVRNPYSGAGIVALAWYLFSSFLAILQAPQPSNIWRLPLDLAPFPLDLPDPRAPRVA
jgi:hypothetical protein